jgi:hypothetical protein
MNEAIIHRRELVARIRGQNVVGLSLLLAAARRITIRPTRFATAGQPHPTQLATIEHPRS